MENDPYEQTVIANIAEHGWAGTIIESDNVGPGFEYTTGLLATLDHPEVIMFGLPNATLHDVLWQVFREIKANRSFRESGLYEGLLEGYACRVEPVHPTWHGEFFGYALWHRRHAGVLKPFSAVQCVWPDKQGLFPGEAGCSDHVVDLQPALWVPNPKGN